MQFQSTRPVWGATHDMAAVGYPVLFQSTRPVWGATKKRGLTKSQIIISIHAPRVGRDAGEIIVATADGISIHAPRVGRDINLRYCKKHTVISIHAPRVGRDSKRGHDFPLLPRIYGHSPPQIRFSRHLRPTPLLRHDSRTYIFTFCFLFTSPSHSVINAQMMMAASKS